jgi:hypothetical protein
MYVIPEHKYIIVRHERKRQKMYVQKSKDAVKKDPFFYGLIDTPVYFW